jgi:hypothetical protein
LISEGATFTYHTELKLSDITPDSFTAAQSAFRPYRTDVVLNEDDFSVSVRIDFAMDDSLGKTYPLAAAGAAWIDTDIF